MEIGLDEVSTAVETWAVLDACCVVVGLFVVVDSGTDIAVSVLVEASVVPVVSKWEVAGIFEVAIFGFDDVSIVVEARVVSTECCGAVGRSNVVTIFAAVVAGGSVVPVVETCVVVGIFDEKLGVDDVATVLEDGVVAESSVGFGFFVVVDSGTDILPSVVAKK